MKYRLLAPALYPIRGLLYFLYHPTLFKSCIELILRLFLLTVGVWLALWFTTYDVQYFVLAKVFGRGFLGRSATLGALLAEAIVPVYLLSERFTRAVSHRLFDTVLKQQGLRQPSSTSKQERTALQTNFREQQQYHSEQQREWGVLWRVCTWITNIFLQPKATESAFRQYLRMACTTPILALGPIGPLAFSYLNGFGSTATLLDHYLIQKDLKQSAEREAWYQLHKQEFRIFGAVVFAMNAIPVVNFLFRFTNTVGAALWAADIEKNKTFISGKPQRRDASPLKSLTSTITQVQSLGSSPMTRSQKAAHKIIASGQ